MSGVGNMDEKVRNLFRDVLGVPDLELVDDMTASDVPSWDSLNHIILVTEIEDLLEIEFTTSDLLALHNVGDFKALIARKLSEKGKV